VARRGETLELAVLGLLHESPMHGYELRKQVNGVLGWSRLLSYGSLYPALKKMLKAGWIAEHVSAPEPGAAFQASATANSALPIRRLVTAACAPDQHCLVYYERGGQSRSWVAALFQWTPAATRLEWGGTAPAGTWMCRSQFSKKSGGMPRLSARPRT